MSVSFATNRSSIASSFYVVAKEQGKVRDDLPAWASQEENPFRLENLVTEKSCETEGLNDPLQNDERRRRKVKRLEIKGVPGAFQLLNVLSAEEASLIVHTLEEIGFTDDAAVSLPRSIRHNSNLNWIADDTTLEIVWERCKQAFQQSQHPEHFMGRTPLGLNGRFRVYRYHEHDFFKFHTDGSWPGSRVRNGALVTNAFDDRWSLYTFLIFLTEDFEGGETEFLVNRLDPSHPARNLAEAETVGIRTPVGGVLCFPHGEHPLHCLHASATITKGVKYIIRTDVLFGF